MYPYYILLGWFWFNTDNLIENETGKGLRSQRNLVEKELD